MPIQLCRACLSTNDAGAAVCGQCGAPLRPRRRPGAGLAALAAVAATAAAAWWIWQPQPEEPEAPDPPAARAEPGPEAPAPTPPEGTAAVVSLLDLRGGERPALALRRGEDHGLLVALAEVPRSGPLHTPGGEEVGAVAWDSAAGWALLRAPGPRASELPVAPPPEPGSEVRAGGAPARVTAVDGETGLLELDPPAKPETAVVDATGRAVALAGRRGDLVPAWPVRGRLHEPAGPLAELQGARAWGFEPGLMQAAAAVDAARTPVTLRDALGELERAAYRQTDPEVRARAEERIRAGLLELVRTLGQTDPATALAEARAALRLRPDHRSLLTEAVRIAAASDPEEALTLLQQLRTLAPEAAERLAEPAIDAAFARARERVEARAFAAADRLLQRLSEVFSERRDVRATVHLLRAGALEQQGRLPEAVAEAEHAARLDPDAEPLAARLRDRLAERPRPQGRIELPIDPDSLSVRARVAVGGVAADFVVDTGASLTAIPTAVRERLGLAERGRARVETAGGIVEAPVVEIPELTLGPLRLESVRAVVLDLPGSLAGKGLLGMNVLRRLNVRIERERGVMVLDGQGR